MPIKSKIYQKGDIDFDRRYPFGGGGYGDVFAGLHKEDGKVALKRLRTQYNEESRQVNVYSRDLLTYAEAFYSGKRTAPRRKPWFGRTLTTRTSFVS